MNICVVSTFDGTTDDFMEIFNWAKDKASAFATDMEKFQEIMTSEEMKAWDTKHNCVDVVYSLEEQ